MIELEEELLFPWIEKQIQKTLQKYCLKKNDLINLGIGDTCDPLPKFIEEAIKKALHKMTQTHIGYGAEQGREEFRQLIAETIYPDKDFCSEEIFITEGIANSLGLLLSLFDPGANIAILSPTYPVYKSLLEVGKMNIVEIQSDENFSFSPPEKKVDAIILCSPNNPTGIAFSRKQLQEFVDWANENDSLILFDGAYEAFIFDRTTPKSIYEIEGAKKCAIELRSFSKSIGFSGLRLGYFVVPKEMKQTHTFCKKIITSKTNGVSFPIQEAGMAALSEEGLCASKAFCKKYMLQTRKLKDHLLHKGEDVFGGIHAPYLFWKVGIPSKEKFIDLLHEQKIITIPGVGFNKEGYIRLSGFISDNTLLRVCKLL